MNLVVAPCPKRATQRTWSGLEEVRLATLLVVADRGSRKKGSRQSKSLTIVAGVDGM
jgi:hypothetical protein